ncbi:MAG: hypothetical protein R6U43_03740 [Candidatus Krumholzibacteriales bacterium]
MLLQKSLRLDEGSSSLFSSSATFKFQPLVYAVHYFMFEKFRFNPRPYFMFNIILHAINAFLVYLMVNTLLRDMKVALLSGILFVFTVGNYGKAVMIASGFEDLMITTLTLLTMLFYFKNELEKKGRIFTVWFFLTFLFFLASMLVKSTSFSILGCFLAFNFFFHDRGGENRKVFDAGFVVLLAVVIIVIIAKSLLFQYTPVFYRESPGILKLLYITPKNVINYLVRMIFPIHTSHLVSESGTLVVTIHRLATGIRFLIALTVISYSFFGFVFGNKTIRFFIAWTYIMVLPFSLFQFPSDWLNIRHLYLVSAGFTTVISAGAVYCSRLISHKRWFRMVPLAVPFFFIVLAFFIITQLNKSYDARVDSPPAIRYRKYMASKFPSVQLENGKLRYKEE